MECEAWVRGGDGRKKKTVKKNYVPTFVLFSDRNLEQDVFSVSLFIITIYTILVV